MLRYERNVGDGRGEYMEPRHLWVKARMNETLAADLNKWVDEDLKSILRRYIIKLKDFPKGAIPSHSKKTIHP